MSQAEKNGFSSVTFFVMIRSDRSNYEKDAALRDLSLIWELSELDEYKESYGHRPKRPILKRPYPNGYSQTAIPKRACVHLYPTY